MDPIDVHAALADLGYRILDIKGRELTASEFRDSSIRQEVWDYVAIPTSEGHRLDILLGLSLIHISCSWWADSASSGRTRVS